MAYRAVVSLKGASGSPLDRYINTFAFDDVGPTSTDLDNATVRLTDFYNAVQPGGNTVVGMLSEAVAANGHTITYYDLGSPPPNLPLRVDDLVFGAAPNSDGLPEEIALCLSFKGAPVAGTSTGPGPHLPARVRGRIYVGPLAKVVCSSAGGILQARPIAGVIEDLAAAGDALRVASAADADDWVIWSPTNGSAVDVETVWVDDAWDIQRRRGSEPTRRVTLP